MRLDLFIASRHLRSRERRKLISIITLISIVGVVVGVAALIAVIAVMDGAQNDYFKKLIDQFAHVIVKRVEPWGEYGLVKDYEALIDVIEEDPEVIAASPVLERFALLRRPGTGGDNARAYRPARIFGVDPELESRVTNLVPDAPENLDTIPIWERLGPNRKDVPDLMGKRIPGNGEIVMGRMLADQMGLNIGDEIRALTKVAHTANGFVARQPTLKVAGIFKSGLFETDQMVAYTSLETAQNLYVLDRGVDLVHARLKNPYAADAVKKRLLQKMRTRFTDYYMVRSWGELNPEFFKALFLEKLAMFILLLLIVCVAALNIISTLILVTMEKTRQIGILRAMGTSRRAIARIFLLQGALIGVVGTGLGVILGLAICAVLKYWLPKDLLPESVYGLDGLPVLVRPATILIIMVSSITICLLASIIPAFTASRMNIVEALRHE